DMFYVNDLAGEKVFVAEQGVPDSKKDDAVQVNNAATTVSTASTIPVTTVTTTTTKEIILQEPSESITTTTTIPTKDKGGIIVEEPAKIEDDQLLVEILKAKEQEELTIEEKAKLFQQLLEKRKKHFAEKGQKKRGTCHLQELNKGVLCSEVRAEGSETREKSSSKRAGDELKQEKAKKQKVYEDKETTKLQSLMEVIPGEVEVVVDAIPLAIKPPSIVD
ncbi:hypothetical protein Tco_0054852, partial [Tanacetum coccineum]